MLMASKVSARQIIATITPKVGSTEPKWNEFRFPQVSGGEITASVEKVYDGGSMFPSLLCAPAEIGDISLTAYYDDSFDGAVTDTGDNIAAKINVLRQRVGRAFYDIDISIYDCDIKVIGSDRQYKNALLVALSEPDGDASSGAPAMFSMTFSVQNVSTPAKKTT
jgi:hypothetical protein